MHLGDQLADRCSAPAEKLPLAGLDATELAERLLSLVAVIMRLQEHSLDTKSDSAKRSINNLTTSLAALYTVHLPEVCLHLQQLSLNMLNTHFQVLLHMPVLTSKIQVTSQLTSTNLLQKSRFTVCFVGCLWSPQ